MYTSDYVETDRRHNSWLYVHDKITKVLWNYHPEVIGELSFYEVNLAVFYVKATNPSSDGYRCIRGRLEKLMPDQRAMVLELSGVLSQPSGAPYKRLGDKPPPDDSSDDSDSSSDDSDDERKDQAPSDDSDDSSDSSSDDSSASERDIVEIDPDSAQMRQVTSVKAPTSDKMIYDSRVGGYVPREEYEERNLQRFSQLSKDQQKLVMAKFKELRERKARGLIPANYGMEGVNAFIPESKSIPGARLTRVSGLQVPDRIELVKKGAKSDATWKRAVKRDTGYTPDVSMAKPVPVSGGGSSRFSELIRIYDDTGRIADIASTSNHHH